MSRVAIIPARGGSKRIPRKNSRDFLGKPILAYSIAAALQSQLFTEVMVSTEDDSIAQLAIEYGATVPFRRSERTATDHASTTEVLLEVLTCYEEQDKTFDHGCCIYPTAPLVTPDLLADAWHMLMNGEFDTVFPILRFSYPVQRSLRLEGTRVAMMWPEYRTARSQDLLPAYHDAGQFYWFTCATLKATGQLLNDRTGGFLISDLDAHDIDTLEDWAAAEFKYEYRLRGRVRS